MIYLNFCLNDKREKNYVGISRSCLVILFSASSSSLGLSASLRCAVFNSRVSWSFTKVIIHFKSRTSTRHSTQLDVLFAYFSPFFCHRRRHFVAALAKSPAVAKGRREIFTIFFIIAEIVGFSSVSRT